MPTWLVPGIGAKMRTPGAASASAMSSCNAMILLTRTPLGRSTLNSVTVGPATQPTTVAMMLKSSSVPCSSAAVAASSRSSASAACSLWRIRLNAGSVKPPRVSPSPPAIRDAAGAAHFLRERVTPETAASGALAARSSLRVMGAGGTALGSSMTGTAGENTSSSGSSHGRARLAGASLRAESERVAVAGATGAASNTSSSSSDSSAGAGAAVRSERRNPGSAGTSSEAAGTMPRSSRGSSTPRTLVRFASIARPSSAMARASS